MKCLTLFLFAITFIPLQAQTNSILRVQPINSAAIKSDQVLNRKTAAYRSGMALIVLGPLKMAIGCVGMGFVIADLSDGDDSTIGATLAGSIGGFHLATGIALTASGAILLKKAKRQSGQGSSMVYMSVPDVKIYSPIGSGANPAFGLHTVITF